MNNIKIIDEGNPPIYTTIENITFHIKAGSCIFELSEDGKEHFIGMVTEKVLFFFVYIFIKSRLSNLDDLKKEGHRLSFFFINNIDYHETKSKCPIVCTRLPMLEYFLYIMEKEILFGGMKEDLQSFKFGHGSNEYSDIIISTIMSSFSFTSDYADKYGPQNCFNQLIFNCGQHHKYEISRQSKFIFEFLRSGKQLFL